MKPIRAFVLVLTLLAFAVPAAAAPFNVALGGTVTSTGAIGVITCCFPDATVYPPAALSSLTDGAYLAEGTYWQDGTIWWDERNPGSANNIIEIDLHGQFLVNIVSLQADNNDNYGLSVRDNSGNWTYLGYFVACCSAGMHERSGSLSPFVATAFRIDAFSGDEFYSLSEFQAIGQAVPEPASLLLLASGLLVVARRLHRRQP